MNAREKEKSMNKEQLMQNMIGQIKEAQMKLGYAYETIRLYYTLDSLNAIVSTTCKESKELVELLDDTYRDVETVLGKLKFSIYSGRIEITISKDGSKYVHENVDNPSFLKDIIQLFQTNHHCELEEIKQVFEKYSEDYVCESMPEDADFDYVLYFKDTSIDEYFYCVKMEMGHTIYHRFGKEDYEMLLR